MLGHDASWGLIHAVKATHEPNETTLPAGQALELKKVGYLASSLLLDESSELALLMVNSLQQDMRSDNILVGKYFSTTSSAPHPMAQIPPHLLMDAVCMALSAATKIAGPETAPTLVQPVVDLLSHSRELVRKKAIVCLHNFYLKCPASVEPHLQSFRQMLCDTDPSVISASVLALETLVRENPDEYKRLVPSLINLLKQVIDGRLPKSYSYHRSPAPFIQIRIMRVLGPLGHNDQSASEQMYSVMAEVLRKADNNSNIGIALVYEAVSVVSTIYPHQELLHQSANIVSRYLSAKTPNMKYMGVKALIHIVKASPQAAIDHQMAVIDCLDSSDESLKKATLNILFHMAKSHNVETIVARMMDYIRSTSSRSSKQDTVQKVVELAERYAPSNQWFINTMTEVFEEAGVLVRPQVAQSLMELLREGTGESDVADRSLRLSAVQSYLSLLDRKHLPALLLELISWCIGEFGVLCTDKHPHELMEALRRIGERAKCKSVESYVISALGKVIAASTVEPRREVLSYVRQLAHSGDSELRQRACELEELRSMGVGALKDVLPPECSVPSPGNETLALESLDSYIQRFGEQEPHKALPEPEAKPANTVKSDRNGNTDSGLKIEPYGKSAQDTSRDVPDARVQPSTQQPLDEDPLEPAITRGNKRWGAENSSLPHKHQQRPASEIGGEVSNGTALAVELSSNYHQQLPQQQTNASSMADFLDEEPERGSGTAATEVELLEQELETARPLPTQSQMQGGQQGQTASASAQQQQQQQQHGLDLNALYAGAWQENVGQQQRKPQEMPTDSKKQEKNVPFKSLWQQNINHQQQ